MLSSILLLASAAASVLAAGTVHSVKVGEGGLVYNPSTVIASVGDQVQFEYYPRNHSVVQSAPDSPCEPLAGGIYSGFIPSANGESPTTFVLTIKDTNPIYFYCSQASHCQAGMVGIINAPSDTAINDYKTRAAAANGNVSPSNGPQGGVVQSAGAASASGSSSAASATATTTVAATTTVTGSASRSATGSATAAGSATATGSAASASASATASGSAAAGGSGTATGSAATPSTTIRTAAAGRVGSWGVGEVVAAAVVGMVAVAL